MPRDPNTCANINEVVLEHMELDWFVDFDKKLLKGSCVLNYYVLKDTTKIVLDISDQHIERVELNSKLCKPKIGEVPLVGRFLQIDGDFKEGEKGTIFCRYSTSSTATALQFVDSALTADKTHPFLYSQCQQIHARSIVPCMDTPAVKQIYTASVDVPKGMQCLMSAVLLEDNGENSNPLDACGERVKFHFVQKVPIPSYLLAIVVGGLEKRDISPRCAVWAEPSMVERAHWEFAETEEMLKIATELMGPYRWGRFDMIVLPPFFSFGGMENPCMTFVTPTIIAGDRSLTTVVAHEIAHSWTGNLVTNATWEHFWLNEGFTEYVEYKILGRMFGEQFRLFMHHSGWEDHLRRCVFETFHPKHPFTRLVVPLDGECADDVFSPIPYQKGAALLLLLEQRLADNARFEQFLRDYVVKFAYRSIVSDEWLEFLYEYYADKRDVLDTIEWQKWLHQPGMPPQKPTFDETLLIACQTLANTWLYGSDEAVKALEAEEFQEMLTAQKEKFLSLLDNGLTEPKEHLFNHNRIELMEKKYSLNTTGNCDVKSQWILLAIQARWEPILPLALQFVTECGRVKYVRGCYQRLFEWDHSRPLALACFEQNRPQMHNFTAQFVLSLLSNKNKANGDQNGTKNGANGKVEENGTKTVENGKNGTMEKGHVVKNGFVKAQPVEKPIEV